MFLGAALIFVSGYHLIPAILTGEIPANWPVKPLTRDGKPLQFQITFGGFTVVGLAGVTILVWNALQHFGVLR